MKRNIKAHHKNLLIVLVGLNFIVTSAYAKKDQSSPILEASFEYNDNVFLLSDTESPIDVIGDNSQSDLISQLRLGYITEITRHRQDYELDISAFRSAYNNFDRLDFTGGNVKAKWDWFFNKQWDGRLLYNFRKDQSNFEDERLPQGDLFDWHQFSARINRNLSKKSAVYALLGYKQKEYEERLTLDNDLSELGLGFEFIGRNKNTIALEFITSNGEYSNRVDSFLPEQSLREFDESRIKLKTKWFPSSKSELAFNLAYVEREHNSGLEQFDFDGAVFDLGYTWDISNKASLLLSFKRDLVNTENTRSLFTEQDHALIRFEWTPSNRLALYSYLARRDIEFTQIEGNRDDTLDIIAVGGTYQLWPNVFFDLKLEDRNRDSSNQLNQYDNQIAILTITYSAID